VSVRDPHLVALQEAVERLQRALRSVDAKLCVLAAGITRRDPIGEALDALEPVAQRLAEVIGPPEQVH
jgi:hypothetical protein